jgi:carboxyl-terminal processing protease
MFFVFVLGLFVARLPQTLAYMGLGARPDPMRLVEDVHALVLRGYVEPPDDKKLAEGAINGMLESLDDPYAEFIPADEAADFEKAMTGSFSGIGAQVETKDGFLSIVSPLEDSPAWQAGILAGDKVVKINGTPTSGLSTDKCIKLITGEPGTSVHLDVLRGGKELQFDIVRARIVSKSVRGFRRKADGSGHWDFLIDPGAKVAYVRMSQFTPTSPEELFEALTAAERDAGGPLGGLVLDLRFNPGGLMDAAIEICDHFLDSGTIMSTRGRGGQKGATYTASTDDGPAPKYPIAVLVNGSSASASEIVSGCLQDNHRAVVIGTRTYGKGLVQGVQSVPSDPRAQVKFTIQRYYLPSGRLIQRTDDSAEWGVDPSPGLFVPMTDEETVAWLLLRRDWDVLRKEGTDLPAGVAAAPEPGAQRWTDPAWVRDVAKDKQLAAAVDAMGARLARGEWPSLSEVKEQHAKIAMAELKVLERTRERMGKEFARLDKRVETLEHAASAGVEPPKVADLWADDVDPTGGTVEVKDKDGKVIAELKVTGRDLERWLAFADVKKADDKAGDAAAAPQAEPTKSAKGSGPAGNPTP